MFCVTTAVSLPVASSELAVRLVGLGVERDHALAVELVELRRVLAEELMAEHGLGRVLEVLVVQAVLATEVGDAAGGRDPRPAKEDHLLRTIDICLELGRGLRRVRDRMCHALLLALVPTSEEV